MSDWKTIKARRLLTSLSRIGWRVKRQTGSHKILERPGWPDIVFAFHDKDEIGPKMLARVAKVTGLTPEDI
jgi:predicted RNA binding protein YcfA (HicA-like mRNA interferase family)